MCYYYIILLYTVHVGLYAEAVCAFVRGDVCAYVCVRTCMRTYMRIRAGAYTYVRALKYRAVADDATQGWVSRS